jgi:hypothetical protein
VATGSFYVDEAASNAAAVRHHHPGCRICLVTDDPRTSTFWDDLVIIPKPSFGFDDKIQVNLCPYERFLFLDTDVQVVGDMTPAFDLLDRHDLCGVHLFEGHDYRIQGIPDCYPEINSGVLGLKKSDTLARFFDLWAHYYKLFYAENQKSAYAAPNVGDQKSLRAAAWHSDIRMACMGPEFNFVPFRTEFAAMDVRAIHTRSTNNISELVLRLNETLGRRAYVPHLDSVVGSEMSSRACFRLAPRLMLQILRIITRRLIPKSASSLLRKIPVIKKWLSGGRYESSNVDPNNKWRK